MKKFAAALLLAVAPFALFAQTLTGDTRSASDARADNLGNAFNSSVNLTLPNSNPFQYTSGLLNQQLDTNQAHSAASSFATPAVWRCATSGWGVSLQGVGGGGTIAGKGGESTICAVDFRIAVDTEIEKRTGEARIIALRLACTDDALADAYEGTSKQCSDQRNAKETREARWTREREQRAQVRAMMNMPPEEVTASSDASLKLLP